MRRTLFVSAIAIATIAMFYFMFFKEEYKRIGYILLFILSVWNVTRSVREWKQKDTDR